MALDLFCSPNSDGRIFYHEPNSGHPLRVSSHPQNRRVAGQPVLLVAVVQGSLLHGSSGGGVAGQPVAWFFWWRWCRAACCMVLLLEVVQGSLLHSSSGGAGARQPVAMLFRDMCEWLC